MSLEPITVPCLLPERSTTPLTVKKPSKQARAVVALFEDIKAGRHSDQEPWIEFKLARADYDEILRILEEKDLLGFVDDKIRYDYNVDSYTLVVRMPTTIHELFIDRLEHAIRVQLEAISHGSGQAALFAQNVSPFRSADIYFPAIGGSSKRTKNSPNATFCHNDAEYPGVIIEVAYSQSGKDLQQLAEHYLLDSDINVQAVIGVQFEYKNPKSKKATVSIWQNQFLYTAGRAQLRVIKEVADKAFRDEKGNPTNSSGLRIKLSDFACKALTKDIKDCEKHEIIVSTQKLYKYLDKAEVRFNRQGSLTKDKLSPGLEKLSSDTPPDEITQSDEEKYLKKKRRTSELTAKADPDY